jgi:hypothetical protein
MSREFDEYVRASRELNEQVEQGRFPIATQGSGYSVSPVTFKEVPPLISLVAASDRKITPDEIPAWNDPLWKRLAALNAAGIKSNHPCVYFYSESDQNRFFLQIGFPVPDVPDPLPGDLIERRDPARWCASVVLIGPFLPHIEHAWKAATSEVARLGLPRAGEDREIYHHMTNFICTEVQIGLLGPPPSAGQP